VRTIDATREEYPPSGGGFLIVTRLQQRVVIHVSDAVQRSAPLMVCGLSVILMGSPMCCDSTSLTRPGSCCCTVVYSVSAGSL
jgi:hypothetical protein